MQPPECKSCGHRHWQIEGCGPAEEPPTPQEIATYDLIKNGGPQTNYVSAAPALGDILDELPPKPLTGLAAARTADVDGATDEEWRKAFGTTATEAMETSLKQLKPVIHAREPMIARDEAHADALDLQRAEGARLLAIRQGLKLSQPKFSAQFGVPVGTLRGWESGRHKMPPYFMTLLRVIEREPKAVFRALGVKS